MKSTPTTPAVAPATRRVMVCHRCRRTAGVESGEVLAYLTEGWPRCCGEVMELRVGNPRG